MDAIEFRIEHRELGIAPSDCVEVTINGRDLGDWLCDVEGREHGVGYAGLSPDVALSPGTPFLDDPTASANDHDRVYERPGDDVRRRAYIMRCICGDPGCSYVLAKIRVGPDRVTWSDLVGSHAEPQVYSEVGPFEFDRAAYERSLRLPERER
jgi:hypothetical protein